MTRKAAKSNGWHANRAQTERRSARRDLSPNASGCPSTHRPQQQRETRDGHRLNLKLVLFEGEGHRNEAFPIARRPYYSTAAGACRSKRQVALTQRTRKRSVQ